MSQLPYPLQQFKTGDGRDIYKVAIQAFPQMANNIYVVDDRDQLVLVDCGSGTETSNQHLLLGFEAIRESSGKSIRLADIDLLILTHAHTDHFGGLSFVKEKSDAPFAIHPLDGRALVDFRSHRTVFARQYADFAASAGMSEEMSKQLLRLFLVEMTMVDSMPLEVELREGEPVAGMDIFHVPGHAPGQVCLKVDDIMLTADHVLGRTTPNLGPESLQVNAGLSHFLDSLDKIAAVPGIKLSLGGHEAPIEDLYGRISDMKGFHNARLDRVLEICREPKTLAEVSQALFGPIEGFHTFLALGEAGAHVEYLFMHGRLSAANLDDIAATPHPVIRYQAV